MLDDRTLALLGDKAAQERITERGELLLCPFCGGIPILESTYIGFDYRCVTDDCRGESYWAGGDEGDFLTYGTEYQARKAWNTRAPILTETQIALLKMAQEPRKFREEEK